jgi:hypothetical protein
MHRLHGYTNMAQRPMIGRQLLRLLWAGVVLAILESAFCFLVPAPLSSFVAPRAPVAVGMAPAFCTRGSILQLRAAAGTKSGTKSPAKPRGYWHDFANVETEIKEYLGTDNIRGLDMPSTSQFRKNGLSSLADAIGRFGGVQEVASRLGLQCGKPKGYWQSYDNTRKEFEAFLAVWRVTAGEPNGVPTQDQIRKAGRQDLISAMQLHGGMRRMAEDLDLIYFTMRRTGAGSVSGIANGRNKVFQSRLWSFIAVNGTSGFMPSTEVLMNFGCITLAENVERLGGAVKIARRYDLQLQRRPAGLDMIEGSLREFVTSSGRAGVLPSSAELHAAGRWDIERKLDEIGRERVGKYLGLYLDEDCRVKAQSDTAEMSASVSAKVSTMQTARPAIQRTLEAPKKEAQRAPSAPSPAMARRMVPARTFAQPQSIRSTAREAAAAVAAVVNEVEAGRTPSAKPGLEELKARFRRRLVKANVAPSASQRVEELEALFRQ